MKTTSPRASGGASRRTKAKRPTVLLIDGDVIAYRAAAASQKVVEWQADVASHWCDLPVAENLCKDEIEGAFINLEADEVVVLLSDPADNFRLDVLPSYKGHRRDILKPVALGALKDFLRSTYQVIERPRLEADDLMGIIATSGNSIVPGRKIIVTRDKDLRTVPAEVYFLGDRGGRYRSTKITPEEADRFWMLQTLMGDTADGYKGCPGVGDIKAAKLLAAAGNRLPEWWDCVVSAFEAAGQSAEEALAQARCARILRAEDYDWTTGEVTLWSPRDGGMNTRSSAPDKPKRKLQRQLKGIRAMTRLRDRTFGRF